MWKPLIPLYLPCRQASHDEQDDLKNYLLRHTNERTHQAIEKWTDRHGRNTKVEGKTSQLILQYETQAGEVEQLISASIVVVFDWQAYQASPTLPMHQDPPPYPKVMTVFWQGYPDRVENFSWEHNGEFQRIANEYNPEAILEQDEWYQIETLWRE